MGIPSYYKKLLNELPHLVKRSHPDAAIDWFFMDFNCLIYHCLHAMPTYTESQQVAWEDELISRVVAYTRKVIRQVAPTQGVFLAIDGVVPMAKMRQQRLRRFKSVWLNARLGNNGSWDTNAITPGTAFMKRLHSGLETMVKEHGTWRLSTSDVPGEGEHKIMAEWRTGKYTGNAAVYGLDADLIVLSLLGRSHLKGSAWLFREEVDKGAVQYDADGEELFEWFSIDTLEAWLTQGTVNAEAARVFLLNYGCAMSILGNDFLPSSLGLKMRDDGHAELLRILQALPLPLVYPTTGEISLEGLQGLFRVLSTHEARRIEKALDKKKWFARGASETGLGENNWPLSQQEEFVLWDVRRAGLQADWTGRYAAQLLQGEKKDRVVREYLFGIQWIWSYYTGNMNDICFNWYYPFSLPPLWEWVRDTLHEGILPEFPGTVAVRASEIRPTEQLVLVLPLESWSLIPSCKEKRFPYYAPQFFPNEFSFESVGKRFFWECEARIPLPSVVELKETMNRA